MIIWITGLSGAGKTTIAQATVDKLKNQGLSVVLVDGDAVREVVQDPHIGHDRESRLVNAYRISRFAQLLERQGLTVVVATMSLFHEIHQWNRTHFHQYLEVLVEVPLPVLASRDARGLYSRFSQGNVADVGGLDIVVEFPQHPHLILRNESSCEDFSQFAQQIVEALG